MSAGIHQCYFPGPASFGLVCPQDMGGEKLELRLKSPVGAEAAIYPWPLPVYVSARIGVMGKAARRE